MPKLLFAVVCIGSLAFASCKSSTTQVNVPVYDTIYVRDTVFVSDTTFYLKHATFDSAGTHAFNGWAFQHSLDTVDFEQDAPPGAGIWGFKIHSVDFAFQSDNITRSFTNLTSGVYEFILWSHTKYVFPDSIFHPAWMSITKNSGGILTMVTDSVPDNLTWFPHTMFDTLTLLPTDTVTLEVSCGLAIVHGNPNTVDDFTFAKLP